MAMMMIVRRGLGRGGRGRGRGRGSRGRVLGLRLRVLGMGRVGNVGAREICRVVRMESGMMVRAKTAVLLKKRALVTWALGRRFSLGGAGW